MSQENRYIVFDRTDMQEGGIFMRQLDMFAAEIRSAAKKPPLEGVFVESHSPIFKRVLELLNNQPEVKVGLKGVYELHERAEQLAKKKGGELSKGESSFLRYILDRKLQFGTANQRVKMARLEIKYLGYSRERDFKV